jgi:hypothetical protein
MVASALRISCLALVALLVGCASAPRVPEEMKPALRSLDAELASGRAAMERTVESLQKLMESDRDVPGASRRFADNLAQLTAVVDRAKGTQPSTDPNIGFLGRWKADIDSMQDATMRESARERREATIKELNTLESRMESLRSAFRPYFDRLNELNTYLKNDPTPAGLRGVKPTVVDLIRDRSTVYNKLDDVQSQLRKLLK